MPGVGGLPVGSSGKVVCLLSSGIDSPVATWKLARRGAVCIGVHFSGRPQTSDASEYLVDDIARVLERTGCIARVYTVPFGDYQREIALTVPPELRVIMYRRLMFKVAEALAARERAGALVTGESLGQVASQTLDNIRATDDAVDLPVFRPLIGTDKLEIIREAERLGSYEISSQDAPDCCTLFMPRSSRDPREAPGSARGGVRAARGALGGRAGGGRRGARLRLPRLQAEAAPRCRRGGAGRRRGYCTRLTQGTGIEEAAAAFQ